MSEEVTVNTIVFVSRTGTKYHREGCRHLSQSKTQMRLGEASQRYEPCIVCNPPVLPPVVQPQSQQLEEIQAQPEHLGPVADEYFRLRDQKDGINKELGDVNKRIAEVEGQLIRSMEDHEIEQVRTDRGSLSLKVDVHPQVVELEMFVRWCIEHERVDYLQKRINAGPYREALKEGFPLPDGTDSYKKSTLNMRRRPAGSGE